MFSFYYFYCFHWVCYTNKFITCSFGEEKNGKEIEKGNFREDLYHRLSVIPIHVPPLRERVEDIPLLVNYFNEIICEEQGIALKEFDESAINELKKLHWSGNVRELRNVVERLIILCGKVVTEEEVKAFATFSSL